MRQADAEASPSRVDEAVDLAVAEAVIVEVVEDAVEQEAAAAAWVPKVARSTSSYAAAVSFKCSQRLTSIFQEPHRHAGIFVARGKEDLLVTKNLTPGETVYGEKKIVVDNAPATNGTGANAEEPLSTKTEYRVWNPFRSKLAAAVLGGVENTFMGPGSKVLYLGAASGTSVSHVSDIVGPEGVVYAVEFSHRSGRDLINMATKRTNIIPIIEDARHPLKYRMLVGMVDCIFADVAQPDQARIVALNAHLFLKQGGGAVISVKANCIDSTKPAEQVFAMEVQKLRGDKFKPKEQLTLEPFERDHCVVAAIYRPT